MNVSLILAHPEKTSFNHAIALTAKETIETSGHRVFFHDLYEEQFDPILSGIEIPKNGTVDPVIQTYCNELTESDGIVIVHPNWWGQPPAILKGWIDRVIRPGVAYEFAEGDDGEGVPIGLLKAQAAVVFNTSNTATQREKQVFGDPLERIWKDCIFDLCGVPNFTRRMFNIIVTSSEQERKFWLEEVRAIISTVIPQE